MVMNVTSNKFEYYDSFISKVTILRTVLLDKAFHKYGRKVHDVLEIGITPIGDHCYKEFIISVGNGKTKHLFGHSLSNSAESYITEKINELEKKPIRIFMYNNDIVGIELINEEKF